LFKILWLHLEYFIYELKKGNLQTLLGYSETFLFENENILVPFF